MTDTTKRKYFAFGSNTPEQMDERLGREITIIGAATLPDRRLVYMGRSVKWRCATANALASPGSVIHGTLYDGLTDADFGILDSKEGVKPDGTGRYRRVTVKVLVDGELVDAEIYEMTRHLNVDQEVRPPSRAYLLNVIKAAIRNGIPDEVIASEIMPTATWDAEVLEPA